MGGFRRRSVAREGCHTTGRAASENRACGPTAGAALLRTPDRRRNRWRSEDRHDQVPLHRPQEQGASLPTGWRTKVADHTRAEQSATSISTGWQVVIVRTILIRFYRSFNYDYLRKSHPSSSSRGPWELLEDGSWYPFVEISLQKDITAVVGANEAGKSQLLTAVRHALTGDEISQRDHCRYSKFFAVDRRMSYPDFGLHLGSLTADEQTVVKTACEIDDPVEFNEFRMFRIDGDPPIVYLNTKEPE